MVKGGGNDRSAMAFSPNWTAAFSSWLSCNHTQDKYRAVHVEFTYSDSISGRLLSIAISRDQCPYSRRTMRC